MSVATERLRSGAAPFILYPLLALLSFPTLGLLAWGRDGLVYAHDLLDIPRSGVPADWLAHGLTLWNTHVAAGNALLVQQAIGPYALDVPLAIVTGAFGAFVFNGWLLAAFAGISMHLFLRDSLGLSTAAVVGGSILFLFSFWDPIIGFAVPAIPLLLWLLERAMRPSAVRWRYALAHVLLGAFVLYNGQSQIVVLIAVLEMAWALVVTRGNGPGRWRRVGACTAVWLCSFALYGPVLLTQLVALPDSQRTLWSLYAVPPLQLIRSAVELYNSVLLGVPVGAGGRSATVYGTFFLGAAGVPLLVLGMIRPGRDQRRWFVVALLFAIPLFDLAVTFARPLQEQAGILRSFQLDRVRHLVPFALAATAAFGMQTIAEALATRRWPWPLDNWRRLVVALSLLSGLLGIAAGARQLIARRADLLQLDPVAVGWLLAVAALVLGLVLVVGFVVWMRRRPTMRAGGTMMLGILLVVLIIERGTYAYGERLLGSDLGTWRESLDPTPAQMFLLRQPGIGIDRVLTFGEDANRMGAVGLLQVDGYQTIYPLAYHQLFGRLIRSELDKDPVRRSYFDDWGNRAIAFGPNVDPELVALLDARWLYVRNPPGPSFNAFLYRNLPWTPTVPGIVARYSDPTATVYEVPSVLPRAFLAAGFVSAPDDAGVIDALGRATLDELRGRAFVAAGPDAEALQASLGGGPTMGSAGTATISAYTPDRVTIDLLADRPGVLILTDTWAPGWVAEVDGVRAPILRVDEAFRGVLVGSGPHHVAFTYAPGFTYLGFALAAAALVVAFGLSALIRVRDRRLVPTAPS